VTAPAIVFDLDGTLVDTAHDLVATLNAILVGEGMAPVSVDKLIAMVGSGARVMLETAFAAEGRALTPAKLDALLRAYMTLYDEHLADASKPYPGTEAMLDHFAAEGWLLAVCTNKFEAPARKLLGLLGLGTRFAAITGQDTFAFRKPDPRHLTETIRLAGGAPDNAIMVGDSATDIDTARAAGIPVVAVSFGYSPVPVAELAPTSVIARLDELVAAVAAIRAARRLP
jgi:phosphoglycolate phosphatase